MTMGMLGAKQLSRMKRSAYLIDASAPGVVNEEALAAALQSGRLAGAALDVFEGQPLPESSPLSRPSNIVSPRTSAAPPSRPSSASRR